MLRNVRKVGKGRWEAYHVCPAIMPNAPAIPLAGPPSIKSSTINAAG